jgi:hypothetical protein
VRLPTDGGERGFLPRYRCPQCTNVIPAWEAEHVCDGHLGKVVVMPWQVICADCGDVMERLEP